MKGRVIILDEPRNAPMRAALVVDGRVEDLLLDPPGPSGPYPGQIYWAKVDRVVPNMGGAFVTLGGQHQGFLRGTKGLRPGQGVQVQVNSLAELGKATPVTTKLLYKSRHVIHTPSAPGINVSRQIKDPETRDRLAQVVADWQPDPVTTREPAATWYREVHAAGGYILRSAARYAEDNEIRACVDKVLAARSSQEGITRSSEPGTVRAASLAIDEAFREWSADPVDQIAITPESARYLEAADTISAFPDLIEALSMGDGDPFDHFGVWDEIECLKSPRADLPSGGWMAIDATRAMVTVDVNTGDQFSGGAGMTANVEAARELPRQLRLRGLGGQVIVDFAPMKKQHRKKIEETLKSAFRKDPIETSLAGWTPLGNFELQRKRERRPLSEVLGG